MKNILLLFIFTLSLNCFTQELKTKQNINQKRLYFAAVNIYLTMYKMSKLFYMKKFILCILVLFFCVTSLQAQITQQEADQIIIERLSNETGDFTIYAKEDVQTNFEIATATGETLELGYLCWVYYVNYKDATTGKYLIVKESNGNVLEVNTKNDGIPDDLENWRIIDNEYPIEIPFTEYSLAGTSSCQWVNLNYDEEVIVINSDEELENYIDCTDYPEIDFSQYTLLLVSGKTTNEILRLIVQNFMQLSLNEYELNIKIMLNDIIVVEEWMVALLVKKLNKDSQIMLQIYEEIGWCDCKDELFYYYQDEKLFIDSVFRNNYLLVGFEKQVPDEEIVNYITQTGLFNPVDINKIIHGSNIDRHNFLFVNTIDEKLCSQLKEIISLLENTPYITFVNLTFTCSAWFGGEYADMMTYTDEFYVKVIDANDLSDLDAIVQETNTQIIGQNQYMPTWFTLSADKNSNGDSLQMTQYFYETGKFAATGPCFVYTNDY